jgi:hypothetical protein
MSEPTLVTPQGDTTTHESATSSSSSTNDTSSTSSDDGYPKDTPVAEMSVAQQAAYWKAMSRKHESRAKQLGTPDEIKKLRDDAAELDKLRHASMGEQEKAVAEARKAASDETARSYALRLVAAEFRAATAGRLEREELAHTLEPLDLSKFLNDSGEVDVDKVSAYAQRIAPTEAIGGTTTSRQRFPDLGQGRRAPTAAPSVASGRAAYAARKGQTSQRANITAANQ